MNTAAPAAVPSKFLDLARKIKEIESENAKLSIKLEKSNQQLFRLRLERSILMEKLTEVEPKLKAAAIETDTETLKNSIKMELEELEPEESSEQQN